jgi:pimeloyl-ACP methyl ester carboxylesterase
MLSLSRRESGALVAPSGLLVRPVKKANTIRAIVGVVLCVTGVLLALASPYHEKIYLIQAGGCELETSIIEPVSGEAQGSAVLLHGIAANKKIMSYLARGYAEQGLRVYVPDLPGHGRTQGPFSPARAEECTESLLRELFSRGAIDAYRTILAGHSMGGAIALRVAARIPLAGVIAISPAPMRAKHGAFSELLLFSDPPPTPPHTLVLSGGMEPDSMKGNARELVPTESDANSKFTVLPGATHVSLLFDPRVVRASQEWTAQTLHLSGAPNLPSRIALLGSLLGFCGLMLIATPFLREATGKQPAEEDSATPQPPAWPRALLELFCISLGAVGVLHYWNPLPVIHLFEGDYFAGLLLLMGAALLALHWKSLRQAMNNKPAAIAGAAFAALVLLLLVTAWFDLTFSEAWLARSKWPLVLLLSVLLLPSHLAEELLLGPTSKRSGWRRLGLGIVLRLAGWCALVAALFFLHSGELLMVLLVPYFALFTVLQRRGMDVVREGTGSAAAAAFFGAILLAGFCLVIFPVT